MTRFVLACFTVALASSHALAQDRWERRVAEFRSENARLDPDLRPVVLLGSSSMEGWRYSRRIQRFLPSHTTFLNRGISGDGIGLSATRGINNRLEPSVFDAHPSHVVLLNGRNSIGSNGQRVEATARVYRDVVSRIRTRLPNAQITIVACPPTSGRYASMAPHVVRFNALIHTIATDLGCNWIDLHSELVASDGHTLRPDVTSDGLHFNDTGYASLGAHITHLLDSPTPGLPLDLDLPSAPDTSDPPAAPEASEDDQDPRTPATPAPATRTYVVQPGDTLSRIAQRHGLHWRALARHNRLDDPNHLVPGQVLQIPPTPGLTGRLQPR